MPGQESSEGSRAGARERRDCGAGPVPPPRGRAPSARGQLDLPGQHIAGRRSRNSSMNCWYSVRDRARSQRRNHHPTSPRPEPGPEHWASIERPPGDPDASVLRRSRSCGRSHRPAPDSGPALSRRHPGRRSARDAAREAALSRAVPVLPRPSKE